MVRRILLTIFYCALLAGLSAFIWVTTPPRIPKVLVIALAWIFLIGRIYLEVRFRRSSWGRVLRLSPSPKHSIEPPKSPDEHAHSQRALPK